MVRPSLTAVHQTVPGLFRLLPLPLHLFGALTPVHLLPLQYRSIYRASKLPAPSSTGNISHPSCPGPPGRGPRRAC